MTWSGCGGAERWLSGPPGRATGEHQPHDHGSRRLSGSVGDRGRSDLAGPICMRVSHRLRLPLRLGWVSGNDACLVSQGSYWQSAENYCRGRISPEGLSTTAHPAGPTAWLTPLLRDTPWGKKTKLPWASEAPSSAVCTSPLQTPPCPHPRDQGWEAPSGRSWAGELGLGALLDLPSSDHSSSFLTAGPQVLIPGILK